MRYYPSLLKIARLTHCLYHSAVFYDTINVYNNCNKIFGYSLLNLIYDITTRHTIMWVASITRIKKEINLTLKT